MTDTPKPAQREERCYRIFSSYPHGLPVRFNGAFTYTEAYRMTCDWNSWHLAQDMAWPEKIDNLECPMEAA